jgi:hypothetical protein
MFAFREQPTAGLYMAACTCIVDSLRNSGDICQGYRQKAGATLRKAATSRLLRHETCCWIKY